MLDYDSKGFVSAQDMLRVASVKDEALGLGDFRKKTSILKPKQQQHMQLSRLTSIMNESFNLSPNRISVK